MFKLIAIILTLATGETTTLTNEMTFQDEASCMNFFDTPQGKASKFELEQMAAAAGDDLYKITYKCLLPLQGDPV